MYQQVTFPTATHRQLQTANARNRSGLAAAALFVLAAIVLVFVGLLSLSERGVAVPSWVNDGGGHCVRVSRASDYALAAVPLGSPPRVVKLLVRMDKVVPLAEIDSATTIFAEELLSSETLHCSKSRNCTDVALLTTDTRGGQKLAAINFLYANSWSGGWTTEQNIGAEGTIALVETYEYALTKTHFCWRPTADEPMDTNDFEVYTVNASGGELKTSSAELAAGAALAAAPATGCNASVRLFPPTAAYERSWLSLSSSYLFEQATSKLEDRRAVVEQGIDCAPESSEKEIYELDCDLDLYASCEHSSSLPFRRLSQYDIKLSLATPEAAVLAVQKREALSRLVGSNTVSDAVFFASIRLTVLLIVAFVVFNRAERVSASAFSQIRSALEVAAGKEKRSSHTLFHAVSDGAVGALAIVSRALVLWHQSSVLTDDGSTDVVVWESIGVGVSGVHFLLRHFLLKTDLNREAPLSKLGGSMSLADASVAALLSVVQTPMLAASARDFDSVARLFCGVLIALFVFHRLLVSVAACAILATTTATDGRFDKAYPTVLWISTALWLAQLAAVSFSFGRLFVVPQAFSLVRFSEGSARSTEAAVFFAALSLSIPYLNSVSGRIVSLKL